jgi:hypothetical protein
MGRGCGGILIEFLRQGVHSSLESCCFFPGCAVGFAQCGILGPGCIHLLEQVIHLAVNFIEEPVLVGLECDHSLFDFVAVFVHVGMHRYVAVSRVRQQHECSSRNFENLWHS